MLPHDESRECNARPLERLERNERIECKSQQLKRFDPKREVELEGTFTNHQRMPFAQVTQQAPASGR